MHKRASTAVCSLVGLLALALGSGCTADDSDAKGFQVLPDTECHQVLQAQCKCCGSGQLNCEALVAHTVQSGTAWTPSTEEECAERNVDAVANPTLFCTLLSATQESLTNACQQFPPKDSPDTLGAD